jgi:hypothetical protein
VTAEEGAKRRTYVFRLLRRVIEKVAESGGCFDTEGMDLADQMLVAAALAYECGEIDKGELDEKAIGYLSHYRSVHGGEG